MDMQSGRKHHQPWYDNQCLEKGCEWQLAFALLIRTAKARVKADIISYNAAPVP